MYRKYIQGAKQREEETMKPTTKTKSGATKKLTKTKATKGQGVATGSVKKTAPKAQAEAKVKKPRELSLKQRQLVQGIIEGKTQKQAALDAGYSPNCPDEIAYGELQKTSVQATLQKLMAEKGLSNDKLLEVHAEMIAATKVISAIGGKDAGAGSVDFIDVPDWQARGKGLEMAYRLQGAFVEKKELTGADGVNLFNNIQINLVST